MDEVQMIVTSADRVVPHVQTVTTYANDFNEVQTIELDGDDIDEVQYVHTEVTNAVTEVQVRELRPYKQLTCCAGLRFGGCT